MTTKKADIRHQARPAKAQKGLPLGPSTQAVHSNRKTNPYHAVTEPIVEAATYTFEDTHDLCEFMEERMLRGRNQDDKGNTENTG